LEQFSSPEEEIICDHIIEIPMDDNTKFSVKEYRDAIYSDISRKKKEQRKKMQEKYLAQLGVTPEMLEQQKQAKQQAETASTSTTSTKTSQNGMSHQRTSSNNQKSSVPSNTGYEEEKSAQQAQERKQGYTNARPDSSHGSDTLYQKAQAKTQSMLRQTSTGYSSNPATKASAVTNNYVNQYSSQAYASKPSATQSTTSTSGTYSKMSQSGTNFAKKK